MIDRDGIDLDGCNHDKRFRGVFDLPKQDRGCLACTVERQASELAALREAAGKVTCLTCGNTGRASLKMPGAWGAWTEADCPDCADLRALLTPPVPPQ